MQPERLGRAKAGQRGNPLDGQRADFQQTLAERQPLAQEPGLKRLPGQLAKTPGEGAPAHQGPRRQRVQAVRRIQLGGWKEEVFVSAYNIAQVG